MTGKTRVLCCSGHWECHLAHIFAALCSLRLSSLFLYSGNIHFRALVRNNKQRYLDQNDKNDKVIVVREVIDMVVETGGRFLELAGTDVMTGPWKHAVFARVLDKTTQGLRDTRWNSSASTTPSPRPERLVLEFTSKTLFFIAFSCYQHQGWIRRLAYGFKSIGIGQRASKKGCFAIVFDPKTHGITGGGTG
jgi:hypothetical protein